MANIKVNDIKPAGSDLFFDSESFINDLSNDEMNSMIGGLVNMAADSNTSFTCGGGYLANQSGCSINCGGGGGEELAMV